LVVEAVRKKPALLPALIPGLRDEDPTVRMRTARALRNLSEDEHFSLQRCKRLVLDVAFTTPESETRWGLLQIIPRLRFSEREASALRKELEQRLLDPSIITRVLAMQALADMSRIRPSWRPDVTRRIWELTTTGPPAVRARGRKLLKSFGIRI